MRLTTHEELAGTVDEVHALLTDRAFQEAKCAATTDDGTYTVDVGGGAVRAAGAHRAPAAVRRRCPTSPAPSSAPTSRSSRCTTGPGPAADGSRQSSLDIHVKGAPLTIKGTLRLEPRRGRLRRGARRRPQGQRAAHRGQAGEGRGRPDPHGDRHRDPAAAGVARPLTPRGPRLRATVRDSERRLRLSRTRRPESQTGRTGSGQPMWG